MPSEKKVVLFLVEGPTDETAISGPVSLLLNDPARPDTAVFHGDITVADIMHSGGHRIKGNVRDTVKAFVEDYLGRSKPGYSAKDIHCIVHIIDADGAFVDDSMVVEAPEGSGLSYEGDRIKTPDPASFRERNARKRDAMRRLSGIGALTINRIKVRYCAFFMSRNLEHALYGVERDLDSSTKERLAQAFYRECQNDPGFFVRRLEASKGWASGSFSETWGALEDGANSLRRGTNLSLLFDGSDERAFIGEGLAGAQAS